MDRTSSHEAIFFPLAPCPPSSAARNGNWLLTRHPDLTSHPWRCLMEDNRSVRANGRSMNFERFLQAVQADPNYRGQVAHVERLPARTAVYGELERPLAEPLPRILAGLGIPRLYSHQARAIELA